MNEIVFLLLILVFQIFDFLYKSSILQNQYYDLKRFFLYTLQNKKIFLIKLILIILTFFVLKINKYFIFVALLSFVHKNKNMKVTFTKRIIRMCIIFIFLFLLNVFLINFLEKNSGYYSYLLLTYNLTVYYFSFFLSLIIEKIIQKKYIKLAQKKLLKYQTIIVGITGSYGKTSCKNYAYKLLEKKYKVLYSPKSYNTLMGVTKTINNYLRPYHQILLLEIGVDKKNGMNKFLKYYSFDVGVITCIGNQHLKTFKSIKNIINEKKKIGEKAKNYAIFRKDDFLKATLHHQNKTCFSSTLNADICVQKNKDNKITLIINNNYYESSSNLVGEHNLSNLACAISIAKYFNVSDHDIIKIIPSIKNIEHRLSVTKTGNWTIIDDAYNSNFDGFKNALKTLAKYNDLKVLITPGVIESNKEKTKYEIEISNLINETVDLALLIKKPSIKKYISNYLEFETFSDAFNYLKKEYKDKRLTILIENDLPNIYLR